MDIKNKEVIFLELLAPAGDFECLKAAVQNGADSVYFGASSFSARAFANNFDNEALEMAINYAKLRQEALANILGQSNKDYFCLQHKNNKKGVNSQLFDVNAAKKFFEYTL